MKAFSPDNAANDSPSKAENEILSRVEHFELVGVLGAEGVDAVDDVDEVEDDLKVADEEAAALEGDAAKAILEGRNSQ